MRPVAITMMGFGAFADPVTLDFEDADLFALVGPTGSGKSTVIDAMCFALYGTIPRYEDRRAVGAAVNSLAAEARVSLTFELGGRRYVAVRVVRRDKHGKASTKDARLEVEGGDVLAGTAREMDTAVPELLGLGFDQFTRAVVLPQGAFARFLHDKPAARQDLLVQLLGLDVYERMMQRARALAAGTTASLERDRQRIEQLRAVTPELRAAAEAKVAECAAARARWRAVQPELDALEAEVATAVRRSEVAANVAGRLGAIAIPEGFEALGAALTAVDAELVAAEAAADVAALAAVDAETALGAAGDREALTALRDAHAALVALTAEAVEAAAKRVQGAASDAAAQVAAREAEAHMEQMRTASAAHVVRQHLVTDAPCPVCEQVVHEVPAVDPPPDWTEARTAAQTARETADQTGRALARVDHRVEEIDGRLTAARSAVDGQPSADAVAQALAELECLVKAATEARTAEQQLRRRIRAARDARDTVHRDAEHARTGFRATRDELAGLGLSPPAESGDLARDWVALVEWSAVEAGAQRQVTDDATRRAELTRAALTDRLSALVAEASALGLDVDGAAVGVGRLLEAVAVEERVSRDQVERIDADLNERASLEQTVAERSGDAEVAAELARLLDANHFERWLVSEALSRLVDGGSERFHELSNGRYSFAFEDSSRDLLVVDHSQGDERRSVRTLSGGETFQASLALALALSDQLAHLSAAGSARLESIFLDEGFGTLDAETLEMVATTIENLGASERMVGIVTHVPELAQRMPVQFRVTKGARSSHVERVAS
ncbi:MAG: SMC family ATPase [Acidimicrobiia bacterium]